MSSPELVKCVILYHCQTWARINKSNSNLKAILIVFKFQNSHRNITFLAHILCWKQTLCFWFLGDCIVRKTTKIVRIVRKKQQFFFFGRIFSQHYNYTHTFVFDTALLQCGSHTSVSIQKTVLTRESRKKIRSRSVNICMIVKILLSDLSLI